MFGNDFFTNSESCDMISKFTFVMQLQVTHIKRAREAHQITAAVLHALLIDAYNEAARDVPLDEWIEERSKESPTFYYWLTVLNLEILLLEFMRAVRQGQFDMFKESLKRMAPWFFLFDHPNYGRWLSVHIQDLEELPEKAPGVHKEFLASK